MADHFDASSRGRAVVLRERGKSANRSPSVHHSVHQGRVKKIDSERGFGFVACRTLFEVYGQDVFASHKQISPFEVGDYVSFVVHLNKKGQPQAMDLSACEPSAEMADDELGDTIIGTIKSFDAERGYGFISSPEIHERFGRDVFLHSKQIKHFRPNDHVTFCVRINGQGHPQAYSLKEAPKSVGWLAAGDDEASGDKEEYVGEIKSFSSSHGYGFIECSALFELYGRDVFIHQSQAEGLGVGDRVTFQVQVKRGQPQASCVARSAPAMALAPASLRQLPELRRLPQAELDRRMLRACASARVESVTKLHELLAAGANANALDVTEQTPLMISALNARHAERKCRLLIECRASLTATYNNSTSVLQWARERINPKFAAYLEGLQQGNCVEYTVALDIPRDND